MKNKERGVNVSDFGLTKKDLFDMKWLDKDTFIGYIPLSEEIRNLFSDMIDEGETVDLMFEYWKDDETYHYFLSFEDDTIDVSHIIESDVLSGLIRSCSES